MHHFFSPTGGSSDGAANPDAGRALSGRVGVGGAALALPPMVPPLQPPSSHHRALPRADYNYHHLSESSGSALMLQAGGGVSDGEQGPIQAPARLHSCSYHVTLTFKYLSGDVLTDLQTQQPSATYAIEYTRGHKQENSGSTRPMLATRGQVVWREGREFDCTKSQDDSGNVHNKTLQLTLVQEFNGRTRPLSEILIDLAKFMQDDVEVAKEYWFPMVVKGDTCRLYMHVRSVPKGSMHPHDDFLNATATTVGSETSSVGGADGGGDGNTTQRFGGSTSMQDPSVVRFAMSDAENSLHRLAPTPMQRNPSTAHRGARGEHGGDHHRGRSEDAASSQWGPGRQRTLYDETHSATTQPAPAPKPYPPPQSRQSRSLGGAATSYDAPQLENGAAPGVDDALTSAEKHRRAIIQQQRQALDDAENHRFQHAHKFGAGGGGVGAGHRVGADAGTMMKGAAGESEVDRLREQVERLQAHLDIERRGKETTERQHAVMEKRYEELAQLYERLQRMLVEGTRSGGASSALGVSMRSSRGLASGDVSPASTMPSARSHYSSASHRYGGGVPTPRDHHHHHPREDTTRGGEICSSSCVIS